MSTVAAGSAITWSSITIALPTGHPVVQDVTLDVRRGEIMCLVGESGSGKTTTALAAFGYTAPGLSVTAGRVLGGDDSTAPPRLSFVPQNPATALNPSMRIGTILRDAACVGQDRRFEDSEFEQLLTRVGLPGTASFRARFPHQLSGGQQQRVCIAAALATGAQVIVLDEPTTGLDVVTQSKILSELARLRDSEGLAMLYVTHDLSVAAVLADRVAVMYGGHIVECGEAREVLRQPKHPYTRGLIAATPDHVQLRPLEVMRGTPVDPKHRPQGCPFEPRCTQSTPDCTSGLPVLEVLASGHAVRCPHWEATPTSRVTSTDPPPTSWTGGSDDHLVVSGFYASHESRHESVVAAHDISFTVKRGTCVALVGESGSGKTTVARSLAGLHKSWSGSAVLDGEVLATTARDRTREQRRRIQMIFQSPMDALNPRHSVRDILAHPARSLRGLSAADAQSQVLGLLDDVGLPQRYADLYPRELSGGQRQRVAIARALAAVPELIICDEITSALDVSVQARVLELLRELQASRGLSLLFITHDLGVVATLADEVLVLDRGAICESGQTSAVLLNPQQEYTRSLLAAAPSLSDALAAGPGVR